MSIEATLLWLVKNLWLVLLAIFGWIFKKQDAKIADLEKAQRDFISHQEAKQLISDIVDPMRQQHVEMRADLKNVLSTVQSIQKDLAVQSAVYQLQHNKKDD
jgi:hypothetical protein